MRYPNCGVGEPRGGVYSPQWLTALEDNDTVRVAFRLWLHTAKSHIHWPTMNEHLHQNIIANNHFYAHTR